MFKKILFVVVFSLTSLAHASNFTQLSFLSGCWVGVQDQVNSEECWGTPSGALMLGTSKTIVGSEVVSFEFMRIREIGSEIIYTPYTDGVETVSFKMATQSLNSVVFNNPTHDFPREIKYELSGNVLTVTLNGVDPTGNAVTFQYQLTKLLMGKEL